MVGFKVTMRLPIAATVPADAGRCLSTLTLLDAIHVEL
jgi:hypothetical protein